MVISGCDALYPPSGLELARAVTGFEIPEAGSTVEFRRDEHGFMVRAASGETRIRLDSTTFARLSREAVSKGYKPLPARELGYTALRPYGDSTARGVYSFRKSETEKVTIVVLDARTRILFVRREF